MKHKLSMFSLSLFVFGIFMWGGNSALSEIPQEDADMKLFWYSYSQPLTALPQAEAKHVLLCVYRGDLGQPALLYQTDQRYYPISGQTLQPFKEALLGVPQAEKDRVARFQKMLGEQTDGDWGTGTWTALIEYLEKELKNQKEKVVKFPAVLEQTFLTAQVVNLNQIDFNEVGAVTLKYVLKNLNRLEEYEPNQLTAFALDLNFAHQIYQAITSPQKESATVAPEVETEAEEKPAEEDKGKIKPDDEPKLTASLNGWQIIILASIFLFICLITGFVLWWLMARRVQENEITTSRRIDNMAQGFSQLIQEHHKSMSDIIQEEQTATKQAIDTHVKSVKSEIEKSSQQNTGYLEELKQGVSSLKESVSSSQGLKGETEQIKRNCETQLQQMSQAYTGGYGVELEDYGNDNLALLNNLTLHIAEWKSEVGQQQSPRGLHQIINSGEKYLTNILSRIREETPEPPTKSQIETRITHSLQQECQKLVEEFKKELEACEQKSAKQLDNTPNVNESLRKFVLDHLFEGVAKLFPHGVLPQHFITTLNLVGLEVIPIEIGKTKADPRLHEIQGTKPQPDSKDMIVETVFPGLRDLNTQQVVRKPVVIKGE